MNGVAKTFIGACVAILAVVAVIGTYLQLTDVRRENQQIQKEAKALRQLTPEYVISRCGNPASDDVRVITAQGSVDREIRYQATAITFYKSQSDKDWSYIAAQDGRGNAIKSAQSLPTYLPCLNQK